MVSGTYRDVLATLAETSAGLTGLLFVALSIAPSRSWTASPPVIRQVRAAAALLAFVNTLACSVYGLVPGDGLGYPATVMGVIGIAFTAAGIRSFISVPAARRQLRKQLPLIVLLLLIFGFEFVSGIDLISNPGSTGALKLVCNLLAASLMIGIARAWELVNDRETGLVSSLAVLTGRAPPTGRLSPESADTGTGSGSGSGSGEAGDTPGRKSDIRRPDDPVA
jgi:hypothetical protein